NEGIKVRYTEYAFKIGEDDYPAGSLIITRGGNHYVADFHQKVVALANTLEIPLGKTTTGYVDSGKDFGSSYVKTIKPPKVALIGGEGVSSLNFGEIWHYFEQELDYPLSILDQSHFSFVDLGKYNVLIMPSGEYKEWGDSEISKLREWTNSGGKILAIDAALTFF